MREKSFQNWLAPMPLIAILRGVQPSEVVSVGRGLADEGFRLIEVPLNSPRPLDSIAALSRALGNGVLVGAGTVTEPSQVAAVKAAGGRLIVMPHAGVDIVQAACASGLFALPGFLTPSEALEVIAAGAHGLKLFPAGPAGASVISALLAVLPSLTPVLPVGGVDVDNLAAYWAAGVAGFGLGSALYRAGMDADAVARQAKRFVAAMEPLLG